MHIVGYIEKWVYALAVIACNAGSGNNQATDAKRAAVVLSVVDGASEVEVDFLGDQGTGGAGVSSNVTMEATSYVKLMDKEMSGGSLISVRKPKGYLIEITIKNQGVMAVPGKGALLYFRAFDRPGLSGAPPEDLTPFRVFKVDNLEEQLKFPILKGKRRAVELYIPIADSTRDLDQVSIQMVLAWKDTFEAVTSWIHLGKIQESRWLETKWWVKSNLQWVREDSHRNWWYTTVGLTLLAIVLL